MRRVFGGTSKHSASITVAIGRLIVFRVQPGFSAGLREAIAYPAAAVESDRIVDESSRVPSQRVGVDVRTVTRTVL